MEYIIDNTRIIETHCKHLMNDMRIKNSIKAYAKERIFIQYENKIKHIYKVGKKQIQHVKKQKLRHTINNK